MLRLRDAIGYALITHDMLPGTGNEQANLDPSVLIGDNGSIQISTNSGNICVGNWGDKK